MDYDVIVIGAGPGGIFTAYELVKLNPALKVAVFEAGHALNKRKCPIDGEKIKSCINCKTCSINTTRTLIEENFAVGIVANTLTGDMSRYRMVFAPFATIFSSSAFTAASKRS